MDSSEDGAHVLCQELSYGSHWANGAAFDDGPSFVHGVDTGGSEGVSDLLHLDVPDGYVGQYVGSLVWLGKYLKSAVVHNASSSISQSFNSATRLAARGPGSSADPGLLGDRMRLVPVDPDVPQLRDSAE